MDFYTIIALADATIRMAIPLLLACLAGLFSERAGIFDIGLEGKMLAAAFLSAAISAHFLYNPMGGYTQVEVCDAREVCQMVEQAVHYVPPVLLGLLAGIFASLVLSGIHGLASITFQGNQLISGVAINFLAAGMTVVIAQGWFGQGGRTPSLSGRDDLGRELINGRFESVDFPGALTRIRDMRQANPGMQFYSELISGHNVLVYAAFLLVPLSWWLLYRTRFGLRLRAVGENPEAVDTAGISVVRLRYAAIIICGVLCGIAEVALCGHHYLRRPLRYCRGLSFDGCTIWLYKRHDGQSWFYCLGRIDPCEMASLACNGRLPLVRSLFRHRQSLSKYTGADDFYPRVYCPHRLGDDALCNEEPANRQDRFGWVLSALDRLGHRYLGWHVRRRNHPWCSALRNREIAHYAHQFTALYPHRDSRRWICRQSHPPSCRRRTLCQRALSLLT